MLMLMPTLLILRRMRQGELTEREERARGLRVKSDQRELIQSHPSDSLSRGNASKGPRTILQCAVGQEARALGITANYNAE